MKIWNKLSGVVVAAAVIFTAGVVAAQSLSDMDLGTFESVGASEGVQSYKNPFAKGAGAVEDLALEDLQLTGIVYKDATKGYALISGYLVKLGDKIAGYRVDTIEKDKVKLKRVDEVVVLSLGGGV